MLQRQSGLSCKQNKGVPCTSRPQTMLLVTLTSAAVDTVPVFAKKTAVAKKRSLSCFSALTTSTRSKMTSGISCKHQNCKIRRFFQSKNGVAPNALKLLGRTLRGKTGSKNTIFGVVWPFSRRFFRKHRYVLRKCVGTGQFFRGFDELCKLHTRSREEAWLRLCDPQNVTVLLRALC